MSNLYILKFYDVYEKKEILKKYILHFAFKDAFGIEINDDSKFYSNKVYMNKYYNLSYTDSYVACVLSDKNCSVDIEMKKNEFGFLEKYVFSNSDRQCLYKHFFSPLKIWCLKEAFVKYIGCGLLWDFRNIDFNDILNKKPFIIDDSDYILVSIYEDKIKKIIFVDFNKIIEEEEMYERKKC